MRSEEPNQPAVTRSIFGALYTRDGPERPEEAISQETGEARNSSQSSGFVLFGFFLRPLLLHHAYTQNRDFVE